MASLAGIVQGWVVQIKKLTGEELSPKNKVINTLANVASL